MGNRLLKVTLSRENQDENLSVDVVPKTGLRPLNHGKEPETRRRVLQPCWQKRNTLRSKEAKPFARTLYKWNFEA